MRALSWDLFSHLFQTVKISFKIIKCWIGIVHSRWLPCIETKAFESVIVDNIPEVFQICLIWDYDKLSGQFSQKNKMASLFQLIRRCLSLGPQETAIFNSQFIDQGSRKTCFCGAGFSGIVSSFSVILGQSYWDLSNVSLYYSQLHYMFHWRYFSSEFFV